MSSKKLREPKEQKEEQQEEPKAEPHFDIGMRVEITSGEFKGYVAVVRGVTEDGKYHVKMNQQKLVVAGPDMRLTE